MTEKELKCPVKRDRLQVLLQNTIIYLNTNVMMMNLTVDERVDILKEEIGFTDEEIEQLEIKEKCLLEYKEALAKGLI